MKKIILIIASMFIAISAMGQIVETFDKFEGKKEISTEAELSKTVSVGFSKTIKEGKPTTYYMYTCVYDKYCTVTYDEVSVIFLFDDGTTQTFSTPMSTDTSYGEYYRYWSSKLTLESGKSVFDVFGKKKISAVKLYIFENDVTNTDNAEQFMKDVNFILNI